MNYIIPIITGVFGLVAALAGATFASWRAAKRARATRAETEQREMRNREADQDRERVRDLRLVVDDAACALQDMWSITGAFVYAIPRSNPAALNRSPVESRDPDPVAFDEAYRRLLDVSVRMQLRVAYDDVLHAPIRRAVTACQQAFNTFMLQDPEGPRSREDEQLILKAGSGASIGYQELLKAARQQLSPGDLPGALRSFSVVFDVKQRGRQLDELMTTLRKAPELGRRITGPAKNGVVMVRIDAETHRQAAERAVAELLQADADWRDLLTPREHAE